MRYKSHLPTVERNNNLAFHKNVMFAFLKIFGSIETSFAEIASHLLSLMTFSTSCNLAITLEVSTTISLLNRLFSVNLELKFLRLNEFVSNDWNFRKGNEVFIEDLIFEFNILHNVGRNVIVNLVAKK